MLFLVGGAALVKPHSLRKTGKFVFNDFYLYTCAWSAVYLTFLYFLFDGSHNKFTWSFDIFPIFFKDILPTTITETV